MSSPVNGRLRSETITGVDKLLVATTNSDLLLPFVCPLARKYTFFESAVKVGREAKAVDPLPTLGTTAVAVLVEVLTRYSELEPPAPAISAIHVPSGLTTN